MSQILEFYTYVCDLVDTNVNCELLSFVTHSSFKRKQGSCRRSWHFSSYLACKVSGPLNYPSWTNIAASEHLFGLVVRWRFFQLGSLCDRASVEHFGLVLQYFYQKFYAWYGDGNRFFMHVDCDWVGSKLIRPQAQTHVPHRWRGKDCHGAGCHSLTLPLWFNCSTIT